MRILSVLAGFSAGGAETLVRRLYRDFVAQGHECHLAVISDAASIGNSPQFEAEFKEELARNGICYETLGNACRSNPLLGALQLRRAVARIRPDLLHIHTAHGLIFQALGMVRLPTVYTHHNIRLNFPPRLFKVFDRFVSSYIAICEPCEDLLSQYVQKPIRLINNGVPDNFLRSVRSDSIPLHPTVLSVGALTPQKDYSTLIRAAKLCARQFSAAGRRISFRIVGGGDEFDALRRLIDAEDMNAHVELLGTRSDIPDLMAEADLLVNSSIYEGLPITLIEGAMSALPIVATDVGGNGEVVKDGASGYLVPPGRPNLLAERIVDLMSDPKLYSSFSAHAQAVSKKFTLKACADAHLGLYTELLSTQGKAD